MVGLDAHALADKLFKAFETGELDAMVAVLEGTKAR